MTSFVRCLFRSTVSAAGKLLRFSASGRTDEIIEDREVVQQYGFQSRPPAGAEGVILRHGDLILLVASDDRRYRIALDEGEIALVTDEGDKLHFRRNRKIELSAGTALKPGELTINIAGPMQGKITINAGGQVDISAPSVRLGGLALETAMGIVTGQCSCAVTGAPHAVTSQTAKATL